MDMGNSKSIQQKFASFLLEYIPVENLANRLLGLVMLSQSRDENLLVNTCSKAQVRYIEIEYCQFIMQL